MVDVVVVVVVVVLTASHLVPSYPALQVHCPVESAHCKLLEPVASQPHTENKKINTFLTCNNYVYGPAHVTPSPAW